MCNSREAPKRQRIDQMNQEKERVRQWQSPIRSVAHFVCRPVGTQGPDERLTIPVSPARTGDPASMAEERQEPEELRGGCHCGRVRFRCRVLTTQPVLECNCSMCVGSVVGVERAAELGLTYCRPPLSHPRRCSKKGFLHLIVAHDAFWLESPPEGEAALTAYSFNTGVARHLFCPVCGVQAFYRPRSHPEGYSVNARCLDGGIPAGRAVQPFDGRNWEQSVASIR